MKRFRLFTLVCLLAAVSGCSNNCVCNPAPAELSVDPEPLTLAEVEALSLQQVKKNSNVPQVPMGVSHEAWNDLRSTLKPQDRFYRASSASEHVAFGGYLVMRGECMVTFWKQWVT
mgnify:CR=1 FL=1